ncbi:uncharacterized protein ACNLHF_021912, partial [Anomaloglossus baeobatrachus]
MVTADVEALYTSIKHTDGLRAIKWFLQTSNIDASISELLLILLEFVLYHNFFTFNKRVYLQLQGTAMGASCAPSYANLFLGFWERHLFSGDITSTISGVQEWMRYIDDIWFLWSGSEGDLAEFMNELNKNELNIKLTYKYGRRLEFLDLQIEVLDDGFIHTDVYRKPTATNSLLHASSSHLPSLIHGIPIGQFLRAKRICSSEMTFESQSKDISRRFMERGYSRRSIKNGYKRAKNCNRNDLLFAPKNRSKEGPDVTRDYTVVKKTSSERCQAPVSEGWGRPLSPITGPPPHPPIHEDINDQKILELTYKMIELLTGEVPIRCQDVTVYFSMEEWEYLEGHKDLYKDVMMEVPQPLTSPGLSSKRTTPERCPHPLLPQDCKQEDLDVPQDHQVPTISDPLSGELLYKRILLIDPSRMDMDRDKMAERILHLTLEILFRLTGEDYTVVKKTSSERCQAPVSEGWGRALSPITGPPPHPPIHEDINDQKILELTYKMIELLTGEVSIRCQDVTVYFSMEEWEYLEGHKDLYKDVMMEVPQPLTSPVLSSKRTTPERCPRPLLPQD